MFEFFELNELFSFPHFGNKTKRGVEFHQSTQCPRIGLCVDNDVYIRLSVYTLPICDVCECDEHVTRNKIYLLPN